MILIDVKFVRVLQSGQLIVMAQPSDRTRQKVALVKKIFIAIINKSLGFTTSRLGEMDYYNVV